MKKISFKVVMVFVALMLGCSVFAVISFAAPKKVDNKGKPVAEQAKLAEVPVAPATPAAPQAVPVAQVAPAVNAITQAAVQGGMLSCTSRINQVASFLTNNITSGAFLFLPKDQPDQHIFSSSLELQVPNAPAMYASASFALSPLGTCGAVYDTVEYVSKTCADVEKNIFKNLKRVSVMKQDIAILDAGATKIFLMPAEKGCVVIRKEVVQ